MKHFAAYLHSKELSACCHGVEAKGRDRDGSAQLDQFFRVEEGAGEAVLDGVSTLISAGFACSFRLGQITTSSIPAVFR